jgi:hypothetical protein
MDPIAPITQPVRVPVSLRFELEGRLRNIGKLKQWYMALAEAITNSFDSIEDSGRTGKIEVLLGRQKDLLSQEGLSDRIQTVVVRDNGIGFDEANFTAFITPDSLHKLKRGGKGLGRLMCLQAFQRLNITSTYKDQDAWKSRDFKFQCESPQLEASLTDSKKEEYVTEVRLENLRSEYDSAATVDIDKIAGWLAEHFLPALVEKPKWLDSLVLKDGKQERDLTSMVKGGSRWTHDFTLQGYTFSASCYSVQNGDKADKVRLVASGRVVNANTREMEYYLPHLPSVADSKTHVIIVRSPFFDEHVNDARNGVSFSDDSEPGILDITASQFREHLGELLKTPLKERLNQSIEQFKKRIHEVVAKDASYYMPLLSGYFESKEFTSLSKSAKNEEILASLDAYKRKETISLKKESRRVSKLKSESSDYWESAKKLTDKVELQKKVALAEYVSLRKIILERLEELLEVKDTKRAHLEEAIHNLVFPQRTDSESDPGINHQLWIVDERLESHRYLASDKPMDGKKGDRPDLLIALDAPGAFGSDPYAKTSGYERIVLVEFKRPLKDLTKVATDDLPHRQMMRYAEQILEEKAVHAKSGRPIKVSPDVRFYFYAVCELPKKLLQKLTRDEHFMPSPTGDGAFAVANNGTYYMEYLSLGKLLEDAKARNIAFFKRLGLES